MLVKLKRALLVAGRFYQVGVQHIDQELLKHPHFVRYIGLGIVVPPENEDVEKLETPVERAKRIHEREIALEAKKQELLKQVTPPPIEKSEEAKPADDSKVDSVPDEGKKKSKKG